MFIGLGSTRFQHAREPRAPGKPGFRGNPYSFLGPWPFRETRLRSYIVRQHRTGRSLEDILDDPIVRRCGGKTFCWRVIQDPRTIEALERDVREAITRCSPPTLRVSEAHVRKDAVEPRRKRPRPPAEDA